MAKPTSVTRRAIYDSHAVLEALLVSTGPLSRSEIIHAIDSKYDKRYRRKGGPLSEAPEFPSTISSLMQTGVIDEESGKYSIPPNNVERAREAIKAYFDELSALA